MMRIVALVLGLFAPIIAMADPVKVSGGDHPDFTRVVVEYPGPVNWQMGRTADGYEMRLPDGLVQYDLSNVFNVIAKDRLAAIWSDPETGALHLGIGCACFAMPFEFRPGTIVIDIRPGAPPKGSSFELPLDGGVTPELASRPPVRPIQRPAALTTATTDVAPQATYDWTAMLSDPASDRPDLQGNTLAMTEANTVQLDLEPLRQSLIEQLSRGASQGIVDMAKPKKSADAETEGGNPSVEIRLGEAPNLVVRQKGELEKPLTAKGADCVAGERLAVADWAEDTPVVEQFGPVMSGLTGEFDVPDPEAVKRAVRFYLNLGFGAEARALMRAFPTEQEDAAIWQSMARILDGDLDPDPAFAGMAACDTAAALWAVLADPKTLGVGQVEKSAILRAFSALPSHLRLQLGPMLVDRFLTMQDFGTAIALRDAVLRGTSHPGPEIELMQAAIERAGGSPGASEARLTEVATEPGPKTAAALVELVIQRAEMGQDVSFDQVQALEEFAKEREGSDEHDKFSLALTLAYGASGDFEKAFEHMDDQPEAAPTLWQILGSAGPDSALLTYATLDRGQNPPEDAKGAATLIATRMLTLGLADQAAQWLSLAEAPPTLLEAKVRLAEGKPEKALELLTNVDAPTAFPIRIAALRDLGDEKAVAEMFAAAGMTEEQWNTVSRMQDWATLAATGPDLWKTAAATLVEPAPTETDQSAAPIGPLAKSQGLIASSVGTRDAITALLDAVKSPSPLTQ